MPRQIHILFNLVALFVIMYIVVDTFYRVVGIQLHRIGGEKIVVLKDVETRAAKTAAIQDFTIIVERNIFGATEKAEPPPVEEEVEPIETLEETTLQLSLLGTIAGDSVNARAIILDLKDRGGGQDIYRVGDTVQGAEIRQILRGKVILRHGEQDEVLNMVEGEDLGLGKADAAQTKSSRSRRTATRRSRRPTEETESPEAPEPGAEEVAEIEEEIIPVSRDVLQNSINDLSQIMTQVRVRPYFRGGKPQGLIISQIQADSIFQKLGLLNGDIIASVNGEQMSSPEEAIQLYNSLNSGSQVSIEITRRGKKRTLTYDIQ